MMGLGEVVLLAVGIAHGVHPLAAALLLMLIVDARWAVVVALALVLLARRRRRVDEIVGSRRFFERVSAELAAGASLRSAIIEGTATLPVAVGAPLVRRLEAGMELTRVGDALAGALPMAGPSLSAAIGAAATGGGSAVEVFTELGLEVAEEVELARERSVLTTQARVTAVVVGGAPFAFLGYQIASGTLVDRLATPPGLMLTAIGGVLVVAGVGLVIIQLRRIR